MRGFLRLHLVFSQVRFQYPLYIFIGASVDDWLMHIFYNLPLIFIDIVVSFIFVMLFGFEVDYIATILLPFQNAC